MKHLLNDLSEEEKNKIREQHVGGKKIMIENFNKLVNTKLGDAKPLTEQESEVEQLMDEEMELDEGPGCLGGMTWCASAKKCCPDSTFCAGGCIGRDGRRVPGSNPIGF